ncbi:MAG: hypothetical protein WCW87_03925 [Candidatus Paceibacterota bacterium]
MNIFNFLKWKTLNWWNDFVNDTGIILKSLRKTDTSNLDFWFQKKDRNKK